MKKLFLLLLTIFAIGMCASAQTRTVRGIVLDVDHDEPLPGVSVLASNGAGTVTDIDGVFSIVVPAKTTKLNFSYIGYKSVDATIPANGEMIVKMTSATTELDEVVATAYGTPKKAGAIVGSVSVVGSAVLENVPTPNFVDALQGQVAGLSILSNSGDPSSTSNTINIRGINSLNGGNAPLYILDGAPVNSSVFTTLNPADIESVAVLKDAASLSIYGSRAANGVIVITSKRGKAQKPKFTLRATVGWSNMVQDQIDMMDSKQYIKYRDLIGQPVTQGIKDLVDNYGISTNWSDEMFSNAPTYSIEGAVQGGNETTNYYLSFNHMDQDGIVVKSGMRRETIRASIETKVTNWFKVGFQGNFGYTKYESNNQINGAGGGGVYASSPVVFARKAMPYDSPRYYSFNDKGDIVYGDKAEYLHYSNMVTPAFYANRWMAGNRNRVTFNGVFYEQFNPIKGLTIRAQQALDAIENRTGIVYNPIEMPFVTPMGDSYYDEQLETGQNTQRFERYYQFTYTNTAEYKHTFNDVHNMSVLLGEETIILKDDTFGVTTKGQSDIRQMLLQQGTNVAISDVSQSITERVSNSIIANATYDFDNRYFLDVTYRRDGSSKFAPGHRWASFYSVGAMWNAKNELFLEPATWLDDLRLRVSYGTTGNTSGIGDYGYFGLVGSYGTPYDGNPAIGVSQAPNYDLTWETVASTDVGVSFGIFKHLKGEIDFYHKKTTDMLMDIPYSYTTGFGSGAGNIASMTNTGVDVDLKGTIFNTRDWMWTVNVNFNYNKNKITSLFNGRDYFTIANTGLRYEVGHDAGEFYYVRYAGVDPRDGRQMWYDRDGNTTKVYNEEAMSVMVGKSRYAPWTGGFGTDVRWKWFALHVDFMWQAKKYMINNDRYFIENNKFATGWNQMTSMLNVWTTPGQVTDIPKVGEEIQFDSHLLEDASFVRMKNFTFQYTMPKNLVSKAGFENVAFRFTGRNLLTFTDYTGYDPEPGSNIVSFWYPNTRQYEFGVDITF
ncbi:MAG: TonB-dependent receptor [Muribaculaceae bacterium]|nr:TonB-dependent receptor [Muribaculaceae bacterium]MDE6702510.1 TonB-dependent receptor [Muribaculaceae bacterium]